MIEVAQNISILTPMKGVTSCILRLLVGIINFNSHPHEGGDIFATKLFPVFPISILAPMKGVTGH